MKPVRNDCYRAPMRARRSRERRRAILRPFLVAFGLLAVLASMRLVSQTFSSEESGSDERFSGLKLSASFLNPWSEERHETWETFITGDGVRLDPNAPALGDELFAEADAPGEQPVEASEEDAEPEYVADDDETTEEQGAVFADLPLPDDDQSVADSALDWDGAAKLSWRQETDLSEFQSLPGVDFQDVGSLAGEFSGKTLVRDGKPTYEPSPYLTQQNYANTAARPEPKRVPKVALLNDDQTQSSEPIKAEDVVPGVAFIPSGYRRSGVTQVSGTGTLGQTSNVH